jgi:NitT/TauT family transport system substrate-binding protein
MLVIALAACTRPAPPAEHVTVGVSLLRISEPVFVAQDRGLFKKHGLEVELKRFDTAQPLADELAAGRLDAAGYVALPILFSREGGPPKVRVVTAIIEDEAHPLSFLLVKSDSKLASVASLSGKTVGILPTLAYRRWFAAVLQHHDVDPATVTVTPLAPQLQLEALGSGGVDALFTGDPMATAGMARGLARPLSPVAEVPAALGAPFFFGTFALGDALATSRPKVAAALVASLDEAISLIAADQDVGRTALAAAVREGDRAWVPKAPPTKYLPSKEVSVEALDAALARETSRPPGAEVLWRAP